ncbi:hypothetical protein [Comamonas koreensis]|uniref:YD repeat-containing protein n=1 Tax=Comamonas koreensis TaxID=160825 RepID=A0AAW4XZG7_9BURK|nr:hypothetical protein [Comamonas koreensis]MCD2166825.1 hypothetical protein [Comamonas koreensis]
MAQDISVITKNFGFPLPSPGNKLRADVQRLADLGAGVDEELFELLQALEGQRQKINELTADKVETVNGKTGPDITLRREDLALGPANGATSVAFVYNAQGQVEKVTETIDGNAAVANYTYNSEGTVKTIATTYKGRTRTETFEYEGGRIKAITASEV